MTHPVSITHLGTNYNLAHFAQSNFQFNWMSKTRGALSFDVQVRYSNHCYSDKLPPQAQPGAATVTDSGGIRRIFCPRRHILSPALPSIIAQFGLKPGTSVAITTEGNCVVYRMSMTPALLPGHRYYVFFSLKPFDRSKLRPDPYYLVLYVESAYERLVAPPGQVDRKVEVRRNLAFGLAAEEAVF